MGLPDEDRGKYDVIKDTIISVCVDIGDNAEILKVSHCTVIHAVSSSTREESEIIRDNMIVDDKNEAEDEPWERKLCLR